MKHLFWAILLISIAFALFFWFQPAGEQAKPQFVQRIVDGDTVVLASGERVRLIGIDTPEKGEKCFEQAKIALSDIVSGKAVELVKEEESYDKYGRLLAHIFVEGRHANLEIVAQGYGSAFPFEPNTSYAPQFAEAEARARSKNIGCLWAKPNTALPE